MKFRKWFTLLLLFALCTPMSGFSIQKVHADQGISIFLDGQQVHTDVAPFIIPNVNVTMVPLRIISESLGAEVNWDQSRETATIRTTETTLQMTVNEKKAFVNGNSVALDAAAQNKQGRVMVPLRFVSEQLGLQVNWDQDTKTITLLSGSSVTPPELLPILPPVTPPPVINPGTIQNMRGVWISTVYNLDWPSTTSYGNAAKQKQEFTTLLNELQSMGMNTVFVQVRPSADAIYPSNMVPWSKYLTGTQGKNPGYDPLAFMVEETHKRGMEFHAWFNPFRATTDAKTDQLASNHVAKAHPEWLINSSNKYYINPGIPAARQQIIDEIMEVVRNYDIDGVHLDDYFYPSNGVFPDDATFKAYNSKGFSNKAEWRRDNINEFVRVLSESIQSVKPDVEYGISPFGVWRNKSVDPTGSDTKAGVTAYDNMHADVRTWIQNGWIDYIMPQVYWSFSFNAVPYDKLVSWWAKEVNGTNVKLYIGHAAYKLGTKEVGWQSAQEIINQLNYNAGIPQVQGSVFFSAKDLRKNPLGIVNALTSYYASLK
ncbi:family 10 glycosylhydrolase [Brevibacillus daliensis]|uniref:family 10 glycosylhydrolase n=1 Tax=Brevibacillus daliensis TaxID=2892995 RepID=UPI001E325523|nr:family 10 glycosylhydrolase [Brevibacillus daliensis]